MTQPCSGPHSIKLGRVPECSVVTKPWSELTTPELYAFLKLRTDVFFVEQKVDEEELDYRDLEPSTVHYWIAETDAPPGPGRTVAYLRVLLDATPSHRDAARLISRVVVRADHRGEGLAQVLLERVLADYPGESMLLHAQEYIAPLYAKVGFVEFGAVYVEAGLRHISMYRAAS
jgi:ElaA protein